jgi:hypothetical protein
MYFKNFGTVAAANVIGSGEIVITDDLTFVMEAQKNACDDASVGHHDMGTVLFPKQRSHIATSHVQTTIDTRRNPEAQKAWDMQPDPKPARTWLVWFAGCVGYRDQFDYVYTTSFIMRLVDTSNSPVVITWPTSPRDYFGVFKPLVTVGSAIDQGHISKY